MPPTPIRLPRDRNSLAFLYMLCARAEGVAPVFGPGGVVTGFTGPAAGIARYVARMRPLQDPGWRPKRGGRRRATGNRPQGGKRND